MSLRNVGSGIAVLHGWFTTGRLQLAEVGHADPSEFRMQTRDLIIPAGDVSFWQGAIREPSDPDYEALTKSITAPEAFTIQLLYGDHEGGQRAIGSFSCIPRQKDDETVWLCSVALHWNLDRPDPR